MIDLEQLRRLLGPGLVSLNPLPSQYTTGVVSVSATNQGADRGGDEAGIVTCAGGDNRDKPENLVGCFTKGCPHTQSS
jgi:hypothetical protein